jgi:hypothetical protein
MKRRGTSTRRVSATTTPVPDHKAGLGTPWRSSASCSAKKERASHRYYAAEHIAEGVGEASPFDWRVSRSRRRDSGGEGQAGREPSSSRVAVSTVARFERLAWRMNT